MERKSVDTSGILAVGLGIIGIIVAILLTGGPVVGIALGIVGIFFVRNSRQSGGTAKVLNVGMIFSVISVILGVVGLILNLVRK